jgi:hypothetical protein
MLVRAREHRQFRSLYDNFPPSADFMILRQHFPQPDITQPVSLVLPDLEAIEYGCGLLTIVIAPDRTLSLNSSDFGTLDDTNQLASKISEVFRQRVEQRYYRRGFETRTELPAIERIERTILLRPSATTAYGDVLRVLEILRDLHADPIGLQVDHLQDWSSPCERAIEQIAAREPR